MIKFWFWLFVSTFVAGIICIAGLMFTDGGYVNGGATMFSSDTFASTVVLATWFSFVGVFLTGSVRLGLIGDNV